MEDKIEAPFTQEQVDRLNEYQKLGFMPEFTCDNEHGGQRILVATNSGWICTECDYKQNWSHKSMLDIDALKNEFNNSPFGSLFNV